MDYANIHIAMINNATAFPNINWNNSKTKIPYKKYNIKETDFRIKTATFVSPWYFDLTTGRFAVLISSIYHENFAGIILDVEYDEETGLYTYQCQDWSRVWISKSELICTKKPVIRVLRWLITKGGLTITRKPKQSELNIYKNVLSGVKKTELYDQSLYPGNRYTGNPMYNNVNLIIRDKSYIEAIRNLIFSQLGWFDIWFNDKGNIQITPLSKTDWENTGLHLSNSEYYNRKFKFATTNVITGVVVNGSDMTSGKVYNDTTLTGLQLSAFFGDNAISISDPNSKNTSKAATTSSKKTTSSSSTTTMKNPFNNKDKKIIVSADGGSGDFRSGIISKLEADGWSVTDLGTGPGTHSRSYDILSSKYAVNLTIYNGADPATIAEPVTGWLNHNHKKAGVTLVQMFDTRTWTNPQGMKPYRYGNFDGYYCGKAWDDNYSNGNVDINNLGAWYKKYYPEVVHVCGPSVSEAYTQFKKGGYLKSKGLVK